MIPLFLGLSAANVLVLGLAFGFGLFATDATTDAPTTLYTFHITVGIAAGLMTALAHTTVYTYFMATSKWLQAATDKADLDPTKFVLPALARKNRVLGIVMVAVATTILTLFAGAASDPTVRPWLPSGVHLLMGLTAIFVNLFAAVTQFPLVQQQGLLMGHALMILNRRPSVQIDHT